MERSSLYGQKLKKRGMPPKVLQKLPGHASIKSTMDRHVHVTADPRIRLLSNFRLTEFLHKPLYKSMRKWRNSQIAKTRKPLKIKEKLKENKQL